MTEGLIDIGQHCAIVRAGEGANMAAPCDHFHIDYIALLELNERYVGLIHRDLSMKYRVDFYGENEPLYPAHFTNIIIHYVLRIAAIRM